MFINKGMRKCKTSYAHRDRSKTELYGLFIYLDMYFYNKLYMWGFRICNLFLILCPLATTKTICRLKKLKKNKVDGCSLEDDFFSVQTTY